MQYDIAIKECLSLFVKANDLRTLRLKKSGDKNGTKMKTSANEEFEIDANDLLFPDRVENMFGNRETAGENRRYWQMTSGPI